MARVMFVWELGAGLAHVGQFLPLVKALSDAGHQVFMALRDLSKAAIVERTGARYVQSPHKLPPYGAIEMPRSFAHILHNIGFGNSAELEILAEAWGNLLDLVDPDLLVLDHSPTALLASRGRTVKRVLIGNGFFCPPDCSPLPDLRPWLPPAPEQLYRDEQQVLDGINRVLERRRIQPLERITQLYRDVDELFLTTLPEFDHYQGRSSARYRGAWLLPGGERPKWPVGSGKRIYAYLSSFPDLPALLEALRDFGCPTIISGCAFAPRMQQQFAAKNIHFETRTLDIKQVGRECDVAVLNGNHVTTIAMLLAGKPILQSPIYLEQALSARATVRLGAGLATSPGKMGRVASQLQGLLRVPKYADFSGQFAARYATYSQEHEISEAVLRLEELLASRD